jgi:hypothetical protein
LIVATKEMELLYEHLRDSSNGECERTCRMEHAPE